MFRRLRIILLSASALWQLSNATPADPTITTAAVLPRQNNDNFIGYLEINNTWNSVDCDPGLKWYQSGQYAQCCPTTLTSCYAATACVQGSQIYTYPDRSSVRTIACTENYGNTALSVCNTIYIYENTQDSDPKTNINCGDSSVNWSYYRDIPASMTETSSSPASSTSQLSSSSGTGPTQTAEPESESKAWIAGAVVGPILGLALVGLGIWFFLRRKKKAARVPQYGTASMAPVDHSQPPIGVGGYTDAKPQLAASQPGYYNQPGQPDPYNQQGYPQQGGYSPAPQYGFQSVYNTTANPAHPADNASDIKYGGADGAAELGGETTGSPSAAPIAPSSPTLHAATATQAAELDDGNAKIRSEELSDGTVLPGNTNNRPQ